MMLDAFELYSLHSHIRNQIIRKCTSPLRDWLLVFVELVERPDGIIPCGILNLFTFKLVSVYGDGADIAFGLLVQSGEIIYENDWLELNPKYMTDGRLV